MKLLISYEGNEKKGLTWGTPTELARMMFTDDETAAVVAETLRMEAYSADENEHIFGDVRVVVHDTRDEDPLKLIPTGGGYRLVDFYSEENPGEIRGDFTLDSPDAGHFVNEAEDSQIRVVRDESGSWRTVGAWGPYEDPYQFTEPEGIRVELRFDGQAFSGEVYPAPHAIQSLNADEDVVRHGVFVRDSDLRVLHVENRFDDTWSPAGSYWWKGEDACLRRALIEELRNELFETRLESWWGKTEIQHYISYTGLENSVFKIENTGYSEYVVTLKKSGKSEYFLPGEDSEFVQFLLDNSEVSDHLLGFEITPHFREVDRFFSNLCKLEEIGDFVIDDLLIKDGKTYQLWLPGKCFETLSGDQVVKLPTERIAEYNERFEDILEKEREKINQ